MVCACRAGRRVLKACGEEYGTVEAAFVIARGGTQPLDIASVQGEGDSPQVQTPCYSFLSLSWGIVADIGACPLLWPAARAQRKAAGRRACLSSTRPLSADIESERWRRCCGTARFEVSTIQRILCLRRYRGRLAYLRARPAPDAAAAAAAADSSPAPATSSELLPRAAAAAGGGGGGGEGQCPATPLLAPLGEDVPSDWTVEEPSGFIFLWACNTAWASFEAAQVRTIQHARRGGGRRLLLLFDTIHAPRSEQRHDDDDDDDDEEEEEEEEEEDGDHLHHLSPPRDLPRLPLLLSSSVPLCSSAHQAAPHTHVGWVWGGVADSRGAAG
eukprot:COSAG01_NODE_2163_length_8260_cov_7.415268_3_plen_329_part_00